MLAWYAIRTKQIFRAALHLRQQHFIVYLPKRFTPERVGRRIRPVPDFGLENYLFAMLDPDLGHHPVVSNTPGVAGIVCGTDGPAAMEFELVQEIQRAEDEGWDAIRQRKNEDGNGLRLGQTVRIIRGARQDIIDMHGQIAGMKRGRVKVFVGSWVADCAEADVQPVESQGGK